MGAKVFWSRYDWQPAALILRTLEMETGRLARTAIGQSPLSRRAGVTTGVALERLAALGLATGPTTYLAANAATDKRRTRRALAPAHQ